MTNSIAARYSVPGPARKPLAFLRIRLRFRACLGPPFTRGMVSSFRNKWSQRHSPDHLGGHGCAGDAPALAGSSSSLPVAGGGRPDRTDRPGKPAESSVLLRLRATLGSGTGSRAPAGALAGRDFARADEHAHQLP